LLNSSYHVKIVEGLNKTTKCEMPYQDSNRRSPEYKPEARKFQPTFSVTATFTIVSASLYNLRA